MSLSIWLMFTLAAFLTSLSPGPAILLAVSNAVSLGGRKAVWSSLGNATGIFVVSSVSMAGLGVVLATSATLFLAFKSLGAVYLFYLGYKQWTSKSNIFERVASLNTNKDSALMLFRQGFLVAVTNPKSIVFFTALFPQFIQTNVSVTEQFLVLTLTFIACSLLTHAFYVGLSHQVKSWFCNVRRAMWFNRVSGGGFMLFGLGLFRMQYKSNS
ncbi:Homoserine/homoserine lactone efflux protein [Ephemeroptericola cinctiostellae]|uniref:Homoserine/homoserine lactone efflux protein n=1 Tax=Ephemeroptericola cinctiostellae TaxID=2268024 RepID=A0A345DCS6_9BURK|nr:LysE family translocator [Ephemeroptericola cinctiostellae]AXF86164.1 Homoserine/homoserine lactone efflux protein [Ephemeroptericola cinctiostellae]